MPPAYFAARDAPIPRTQSARVRESNSLDTLHVMMAMFQAQTEAFERLRREEAERAALERREERERAERAQREERELLAQERREVDRTFQRELLSLVCSLVKGPSGSGLLEAARPEISCSGVEGARSGGLLQPNGALE